jgi:polyhydroxybutyrate depolymerase
LLDENRERVSQMEMRKSMVVPIILLVTLPLLNAACGTLPAKPASGESVTMTGRIKIRGTNRSYRIFLPAVRSDDSALPMVLMLHGAFGSAREIEKVTGFSDLANREGFVVVYPDGIGLFGFLRHWNAGFCCGRAMRAGWDDVGFLLKLIQTITRQVPVDPQRIYLMGISNGGMLAHRFAAEHPEQLAAVTLAAAAVGARWKGQGETATFAPPPRPVPVLIIHARDDEMIPLEGGQSQSRADVAFLGPKDAADFWCACNGCDPSPTEHFRRQGGEWTRWSACREGAEVALFIIDQGGHAWPGRESDPQSEEPGADWAEVAWQFMSRFKRP